MRQIADRVAEEIRGEVERRQGTVSVTGTWAVVDGDEVLLRQAFSNLARNALEACAGAAIAPEIRLDAARDDRARVVHVHVSDNGPGIDPALRERVFRPFFTTKRDGTGLGLALVQKIVVTHNGRVRVVDQPDGARTRRKDVGDLPPQMQRPLGGPSSASTSRFVTKSSSRGTRRCACARRLSPPHLAAVSND